MNTPEYHMRQVLSLAAEALEQGEFPIASIVVLDDEIITRATASEQREKRFLGHAELVALEEADKQLLSFDERGRARLFTNLEPCLMCMGAAMSFFLGELV
jgi:tRNA(adenine34) deaminase